MGGKANRLAERVRMEDMKHYLIHGGRQLSGSMVVQGAKNSALPILAASLLCRSTVELHNCPRLSDVSVSCDILRDLGCKVTHDEDVITVNSFGVQKRQIPEHMMRAMRSSIIFLGALLSRTGSCALCLPGGCDLGARPIDLHLSSLQQMGMRVVERYGKLYCDLPSGLHGAKIALQFPSVGATENILLAAVCAEGETELVGAAQEPEIVDLAGFLSACGGKIYGAGENTIRIEGVPRLHGALYTIMPDRIAAATYLCAAAMTGGELYQRCVMPQTLSAVLPLLEEAGCTLKLRKNSITLRAPRKLSSFRTVRTMPYPGFPTDAQAPFMALASLCSGTTVFIENIFENRFRHVSELSRMGADMKVAGRVAVVQGVPYLSGARVEAMDLRGGAALLVAAMSAQGTSTLTGVPHILRGYEAPDEVLRSLGGDIIFKE